MPAKKSHSRSSRFGVLVALVAFALVGVACGGGGDKEEASPPETSGDTTFTVWISDQLQSQYEGIIRAFQQARPEMQVEATFAPATELNDKLLVGEKPDVYISTAKQVETLSDEGTISGETVDVGQDVMQIIVPPGNPAGVKDVSVFGLDPLTNTGLCKAEAPCGRSARNVLSNANITAAPDSTEPDAKSLIGKVADRALDAGMVFRTEAAKAVRDGRIEVVEIPSQTNVAVDYRVIVIRPGGATDAFIRYLGRAGKVQETLQNSGLAPPASTPS